MKRFSYLFILLWLCVGGLRAQNSGRVVDAQGQAVPYVNVVALLPADSSVVAACLTGEDGRWLFADSVSISLLRVSALGYEPLYVRAQAAVTDLTLTLREMRVKELGEATVTARRPVARIENGALVTHIANTTLAKAGTADDVLRQIPGIIRKNDEKGSLEVIGRGVPIVYLNGRQLRDLDELKQLSSEEIKSVEVIHTPGASYDATVSAVVRIRTMPRKGEGWGVNLMNNFSQGRYTGNNTQLKINYRRNAVDLYAGAGFEADKYYWNAKFDHQTVTPDTLWLIPMGQHALSKNLQATFQAGFNLDLTENHALGMRYEVKKPLQTPLEVKRGGCIQANGEYYDELTNYMHGEDDPDWQHALNAYYVGRLGKGELSLDADFFANGNTVTHATIEESMEYEDRTFTSVNRTLNRIVAAKAQYEWPWIGGKVALGSQFTRTNRHDNYLIPLNNFGVSTSFSKQRESVSAAFMQYSALFAQRYAFTAGVRFEHAVYNYFLNDERQGAQSPEYNHFFPSVSLSTAFGRNANQVQMMLAYSAKTKRPGYRELSNNVTYGNRFLMQTGNPYLQPTVEHALNLTTVWKYLQGVVTFSRFENGILFWGVSNPDKPSITTITHLNKSYSHFQTMLTASPHFGCFHPSYTLAYTQTFLTMPVMGRVCRFNNPLMTAVMSNAFDLPAGLKLNVTYIYRTPGSYQNVQMSRSIHNLEAYVMKSFMHDALSVVVGGRDLLHHIDSRSVCYMESSRFVQGGVGDTRRFYLNITYNFNAMRSKNRSKSEAEQTIQRL